MLREQNVEWWIECCEVGNGKGENKNLSYVAVFHCQEHQLRGICLQSLVIVEPMLVSIVLWSVTPTERRTHTNVFAWIQLAEICIRGVLSTFHKQTICFGVFSGCGTHNVVHKLACPLSVRAHMCAGLLLECACLWCVLCEWWLC